MNKSELMAVYEKEAAINLRLHTMGMMNVPTKSEDRIASDAAYAFARDEQVRVRAEKEAALAEWLAAGSPE